jgi:hypothetical protein
MKSLSVNVLSTEPTAHGQRNLSVVVKTIRFNWIAAIRIRSSRSRLIAMQAYRDAINTCVGIS